MSELYKVGNGVKMRFNDGAVTFYSRRGTLWPDWTEKAGIKRDDVISVRVAKGTVFLPENAEGFNPGEWYYTMFGGLNNAEMIDMRGFDTSRVTNMHRMFADCSKLKLLHLNNFNTSGVTDMSHIFDSCKSLADIDLSSL